MKNKNMKSPIEQHWMTTVRKYQLNEDKDTEGARYIEIFPQKICKRAQLVGLAPDLRSRNSCTAHH